LHARKKKRKIGPRVGSERRLREGGSVWGKRALPIWVLKTKERGTVLQRSKRKERKKQGQFDAHWRGESKKKEERGVPPTKKSEEQKTSWRHRPERKKTDSRKLIRE